MGEFPSCRIWWFNIFSNQGSQVGTNDLHVMHTHAEWSEVDADDACLLILLGTYNTIGYSLSLLGQTHQTTNPITVGAVQRTPTIALQVTGYSDCYSQFLLEKVIPNTYRLNTTGNQLIVGHSLVRPWVDYVINMKHCIMVIQKIF